jgi:hypothetical protein
MKKKFIALCWLFLWQHAFSGGCQAQNQRAAALLQVTPALTHALIDSLGQVLYRNYIFPDTAKKCAAYCKKPILTGICA